MLLHFGSIIPLLAAWVYGPQRISQFDDTTMRLTAIVGQDMQSTLECWSLQPGYADVGGMMNIQQLGGTDGASYIEFPEGADIDAGTHAAPDFQYFLILQGGATFTFPNSSESLTTAANKIYIIADGPTTSTLGHHTVIKGGTRLLQMPFTGGVLPFYTANPGPCT